MSREQFPDTGLLGLPWLFLLPLALVLGAFLYRNRANLRVALFGSLCSRLGIVGFVFVYAYVLGLLHMGTGFDPIARGDVYAPGSTLEASPVGGNVYPFDESASGNPDGPLHRARVNPGEKFRVLTSIKNQGPFQITVLGPIARAADDADLPVDWFLDGVWLSSNPGASGFPTDVDVRPFEPVTLGPGEQMPVVIEFEAGSCASADGSERRGVDWGVFGYHFVYEIAFWRRVGVLWPQFEISATIDSACILRSLLV